LLFETDNFELQCCTSIGFVAVTYNGYRCCSVNVENVALNRTYQVFVVV